MDSPPTLHYAPGPAPVVRWRRRGIRLILLGGFLAILWFWGGAAWTRLNFLYWQHRCLTYLQPPDHIVLEILATAPIPSSPSAEVAAPPLVSLGRYDGSVDVWGKTIFLHQMRRPDGTPWLVCLGIRMVAGYAAEVYTLFDQEFAVDSQLGSFHSNYVSFPPINNADHWKFFVGQPDPVNPSHFTFDYELNGTRHTADAWLDNAGKLLVSVRP
jgi:hypothetical protein